MRCLPEEYFYQIYAGIIISTVFVSIIVEKVIDRVFSSKKGKTKWKEQSTQNSKKSNKN